MRDSRFDTRASEFWGDMTVWLRQNAGDNSEQMSRLKRNLRRVIKEDLTPRQREMLELYFFQRRTMPQIAEELGVNISTVSRTIRRAKNRIERCLRYSF